MKVGVTGAAGLLGRYVVEELFSRHEVIATDRIPLSRTEIEFRQSDLLDPESLRAAFAGAEMVIHIAAIPNPYQAPTSVVMSTNVVGTFNALEAALAVGARRFINTSSDCAIGIVFAKGRRVPDYLPLDEDHPLRPEDVYGLSKKLAEELCRSYALRGAIETVTLRPTWVWSEATCKIHSHLLQSAGNPGRNFWSFVDPRDAASAYRLVLEAGHLPHDVYFIAAEYTFDTLPTRELLSRCYPEVPVHSYTDGRDFPEYGSLLDTSRIRQDFGWKPRHHWPAWSTLPDPKNGR